VEYEMFMKFKYYVCKERYNSEWIEYYTWEKNTAYKVLSIIYVEKNIS